MPLDGITMQEGSFITHEVDEWFPGVLIRVEEGGDYGFGDTIRFVIQIDGEEGETWALASQKLSPRSKLYGWVKAIDASLIPEVGEPFKYKKLEDRRVEVMFEQGDDRERVTKIRAEKKVASGLQKKQGQAAAAKKPSVPEGDDSPF